MYQEIEDIDQEDLNETRFPRWIMFAVVITMLVLLCLLSFNSQSESSADPLIIEAQKTELTTYRTAISEPSAAMRRARLMDFISTHPDSDRTESANAMLRVLSAGEADDWATLTETVFNADLSREEKLAALQGYETSWGASLLGGRRDDITALRDELSAEIKKYPSRKMTEVKTSVPDDIEDTVMVGGLRPVIVKTKPIIEPILRNDDVVKIAKTPKSNTAPPKLRKRSNPGYPRKAYRAGISALVTVSLDIDTKGKVKNVKVIEVDAEGYHKDFAKASRRAAKKSRYHPKTADGKAVHTTGHVKRYRFTPE